MVGALLSNMVGAWPCNGEFFSRGLQAHVTHDMFLLLSQNTPTVVDPVDPVDPGPVSSSDLLGRVQVGSKWARAI